MKMNKIIQHGNIKPTILYPCCLCILSICPGPTTTHPSINNYQVRRNFLILQHQSHNKFFLANLTYFFLLPYQLSMDWVWSPNCSVVDKRCYDHMALKDHMDYVFVMDYDMKNPDAGACTAWANSPYNLTKYGGWNLFYSNPQKLKGLESTVLYIN